ncbi:LutC/YkgG family protein [Marinobacterium lutimaris]|uniref:L-lactate dehydrogenase complex protein LldG n=1 Tax=Marinobacterium lutimaris TaxID=568106 RepID=A0A1H6ASR1_9GAMM|nr:lactate utilization protein [Marinobacterium lutimaris]SEG51713.1 L-lactate dehydrogenase complex protein LldG [Marinobacterium lutimaris]
MSKADIFNRIRGGLHVPSDDSARRAAVKARLDARQRNLIPQRAQLPENERLRLFIDMADEAAAELIELHSAAELVGTIENWAQENGIAHLVTASDEQIKSLDWSGNGTLVLEERVAQVGDEASLTSAFCGIAETGTLMLYSGQESPTTLNFLPDTHLVVLRASTIVGPYEDAWQMLRQATDGSMPRTVNLITGPSRSADIEQKLQMGAHGPRRLVIFLLHGE